MPLPPHDLLLDASLFLDLDGTLVEIASRPDGVQIDKRLHVLLSNIVLRLAGRIAIVSGRSAEQIKAFFPDIPLTIAGSHGIEILMPDARISKPPLPASGAWLDERLREFELRHPDVLVERKPFGVALHYRLAPHEEEACRLFAVETARKGNLVLQRGKMVIELKLAATDKGNAVESLMGKPPMLGTRPVFIGDDETDEAGFAMARKLGGAGILVGPERPSAAIYRLATVDLTLQWLQAAGEVPA